MPTTVAAMKSQMGNTTYYILSMKAQELVNKVKIPKEIPGWDEMSIEERYQRDINYNRVRSQIAPYLASEDERFFGAIIVMVIGSEKTSESGKSLVFEPLSEVTTRGLPALYRHDAESMGFLTFGGGELLVPLDGQHRLKAIQFAIEGRDERGREIGRIKPSIDVADDDVTVILIPEDPDISKAQARHKARHIFSRVNKYARSTTTGQNIITDDDDILAVLTRQVANDIIDARLAKYTSNTIRAKDPHFTTLSVIYNCNQAIINECFPGELDKENLPSRYKQEEYWNKVEEIWTTLKESIEVFSMCLGDPGESGDEQRIDIRPKNLLARPVAQECLVKAFVHLTTMNGETKMAYDQACDNLNAIPWQITAENVKEWERVLWNGGIDKGKMVTKERKLATSIIAYRAGEKLTDNEEAKLLKEYRSLFPEQDRGKIQLPPKV